MKRDYQLWKNPDGKTHLSNAGFWTLCGRFVEANWSKYPVRGFATGQLRSQRARRVGLAVLLGRLTESLWISSTVLSTPTSAGARLAG